MATLEADHIRQLLAPFYAEIPDRLAAQLSQYLDLLLQWNDRINLTAVRDPEHIVTQHFGESLFAAGHLAGHGSLLDVGSGAGFPGLVIQLASPALRVTLTESQNKKAAFLRAVVRHFGLSTEVWARRVEHLPPSRKFDVVTSRAVDRPDLARLLAAARVSHGGLLVDLRTGRGEPGDNFLIPGARNRFLHVKVAASVPRGTSVDQ